MTREATVMRPAAIGTENIGNDLRGTAYGFFNLASGLALLIASTLPGIGWARPSALSPLR